MNYTKGEWYPTMVNGERRIVANKEDGDEEVICYGVRHYNIHLIASAPEMYEALKAMINHYTTALALNGVDFTKLDIYINAKKAIAKAGGNVNAS